MADTTFVNESTVIESSWLNAINDFYYTLFNGSTTASGARTALGLGTIATQDANAVTITGSITSGNATITGGNITGITDLAVADGGTGAGNATQARTNLGAQQDVITTRGDLVVGNSTPTASRLAVGTAGQVVGTDGTDILWVYQGLELVDFADLTNGGANDLASVDLLLSGSADYIDMIVFTDVSGGTTNWNLVYRLRNAAGTWRAGASDYYQSNQVTGAAGVANTVGSSVPLYNFSGFAGSPVSQTYVGQLLLHNAGNAAVLTAGIHDSGNYNATTAVRAWGSGVCVAAAEAHDQIRFAITTGTFDGGQVYSYKIRKPT